MALRPLMLGGPQEFELRAGSEAVALAVGLQAALAAWLTVAAADQHQHRRRYDQRQQGGRDQPADHHDDEGDVEVEVGVRQVGEQGQRREEDAHGPAQADPADEADLALVEAIVRMAKALGLRIVAEGVETQRAASMLSLFGVDSGQGYYWSKPLPMDDFIAYVENSENGKAKIA